MKMSIFLILLCFWVQVSASYPEVRKTKTCPGLYCGKHIDEHGNLTECGACQRGYRANEFSMCVKCDANPLFYDWLYLGFMALLAPALHSFFIDVTNRLKSGVLLILHISSIAECSLAALCTMYVMEPVGSLSITACPVRYLSDWYTMFFNPSPDYVSQLHCTVEAVYPLYSMVMIYYAFCLICMMLLRPLLSAKLVRKKGTKSIYAALYFLPILVVTHAVFGGLIYYAFPYIVLVLSVITNAAHFATFKDQSILNLLKVNVTSVRNIVIVLCHWLLNAYGIIAITQLTQPVFHASLICLVPFPTIFYLVTVRFTDPNKLEVVS